MSIHQELQAWIAGSQVRPRAAVAARPNVGKREPERETGLEPATFSLEGRGVLAQ
jgi:hypothetical protein